MIDSMRNSLKIGPCFKFCIFIGWLAMVALYSAAIASGVNDTKCGNKSFNPKIWLRIEGILGSLLCGFGMFSYVFMYLAKRRDCVTVSFSWIAILIGTFLVFFNIVGAITVFGHRGYCNKTIYKLSYGIVLGKLIAYPIITIIVMIYGFLQTTMLALDVASRR